MGCLLREAAGYSFGGKSCQTAGCGAWGGGGDPPWVAGGACLANLCQAVLATAQGRLAAAGEWVLNEKRLTERAGFDAIQDRLAQPGPDLGALVSDVRARLGLRDGVWVGG